MDQGTSLPTQYYESSYSDTNAALTAKSREDRVQDPFELVRSLGLV